MFHVVELDWEVVAFKWSHRVHGALLISFLASDSIGEVFFWYEDSIIIGILRLSTGIAYWVDVKHFRIAVVFAESVDVQEITVKNLFWALCSRFVLWHPESLYTLEVLLNIVLYVCMLLQLGQSLIHLFCFQGSWSLEFSVAGVHWASAVVAAHAARLLNGLRHIFLLVASQRVHVLTRRWTFVVFAASGR